MDVLGSAAVDIAGMLAKVAVRKVVRAPFKIAYSGLKAVDNVVNGNDKEEDKKKKHK